MADEEPKSFNEQIIEEFNANDGVVGGPFEGMTLVLLHTVGAKSGQPRTTPVVYRADGDRLIVFASKAGAPEDPAWFHNIVADPNLTLEYRTDGGVVKTAARAQELKGEERDRLYAAQAVDAPQFKEYEEKTDRTIPVVALYPATA